jgi:hypothetical protein
MDQKYIFFGFLNSQMQVHKENVFLIHI